MQNAMLCILLQIRSKIKSRVELANAHHDAAASRRRLLKPRCDPVGLSWVGSAGLHAWRIGAVSLIVIGLTSWPSSEVEAKLCHIQKLRQLLENNIGEAHASERN